MLLLDVRHPDIFKFTTAKSDLTKVTGANVSVMLTDEFMQAVESNSDFICRFPIELNIEDVYDVIESAEYNKLIKVFNNKYVMKIHAKELFDLIVEQAWKNAEPGVAFIDRVNNYSPDGVYYKLDKSNPCGRVCLK
jgi:ribonucleoside-diphosphate reductase alpha chain